MVLLHMFFFCIVLLILLTLYYHICFCQESICSEMAKELRFAVRCHGSSKKINKSMCSKCKDRHARSMPCALNESVDTLPNGGIRLQDMGKSPYHSRKELNNRYKDSGYLHVDYSDSDTL